MNCEQTLNNLPHLVIEEDTEATDRVSEGRATACCFGASPNLSRVSARVRSVMAHRKCTGEHRRTHPAARIGREHSATRPNTPSTPAVGILCESIGVVPRTIEVESLSEGRQRHRIALLSHRFRFCHEIRSLYEPARTRIRLDGNEEDDAS